MTRHPAGRMLIRRSLSLWGVGDVAKFRSDCSRPELMVYYNSGLGTSGSFAVQLPALTNQTTYDVVFANPTFVNSTTATANVYWGY